MLIKFVAAQSLFSSGEIFAIDYVKKKETKANNRKCCKKCFIRNDKKEVCGKMK